MEVEYDVGFDGEGRVRGLRLRVRLLGGWAQDLATDDGVLLKDAAGMVRMSRVKDSISRDVCPGQAFGTGSPQCAPAEGELY